MELNKFSKRVTQDDTQPAAQAMLHAIGLSKEDMKKPLVGVGSTGYEGNPCNMHLNGLAKHVKQGINDAAGIGLIFNTIGVSDGISMGTPGMRFSLPSRDIIADSMETVVEGLSYDGLVTVVGCDKNMPGALIAMLRLDRPSVLLYGGTVDSGSCHGKKLDIVSSFEAWGAKVAETKYLLDSVSFLKALSSSSLARTCIDWNKLSDSEKFPGIPCLSASTPPSDLSSLASSSQAVMFPALLLLLTPCPPASLQSQGMTGHLP